jgi:hypothetical protein
MGQKRNKIVVGLRNFIPVTINFSEIKYPSRDHQDTSYPSEPSELSDNGIQIDTLERGMEFEELVAQMLFNLEGNERVIFLYQLLRDFGYQIDHGTFAKTLKINRQRYMDILGTIRIKTHLMVNGYRKAGTCKQIAGK